MASMLFLFILFFNAIVLPIDIAWAAGYRHGHNIAHRWTFNWTSGFYPK